MLGSGWRYTSGRLVVGCGFSELRACTEPVLGLYPNFITLCSLFGGDSEVSVSRHIVYIVLTVLIKIQHMDGVEICRCKENKK